MASVRPVKLEEAPSAQSKGARFTVEYWEGTHETNTIRKWVVVVRSLSCV